MAQQQADGAAYTLVMPVAILIEVYEGKDANYITLAGSGGQIKLTDKKGLLSQMRPLLPYRIEAQVSSSLFSGRTTLEVVSANVIAPGKEQKPA